MNVDLWLPGATANADGEKGYIMNSMCDLTQFIISSVTYKIDSTTLALSFMSDIILSFGMCIVVVVDDGSPFKDAFTAMCLTLKINFWCLSHGNHKDNSVEPYHRYLNNTQTINGNDCGTNKVFIHNAKVS